MSTTNEQQTHRPEDGWEPYVPRTADVAEIRLWKSGDAGYLGRATFTPDGTGVTQAGDDPLEVWRKLAVGVGEWLADHPETLDGLRTQPGKTLYVKDSAKQPR